MSQENGQYHEHVVRGAGLGPNTISGGPRMQIDPGWYSLLQNGQIVGQVFVEQLAINHTIEHWWLGPAYKAPSGSTETTRDVSLRFMYNPPSGHGESGLQAVLSSFQQQGGQYVRADCTAEVR